MEYTSTERGCLPPLTLGASPPGWDDYLDLGETVTEMANSLMEENGQQEKMLSKAGTTPKGKDITQVKALQPSHNITMLPDSPFPSFRLAGSSRDNPIHLSDTTDASALGSHPMKDKEMEDEAVVLSHFSDALSEMAASIMDDLLAGGSAGCRQSYGGQRHHHLPRASRGHAEGDPRVHKRGDTSP